MTKRAWAFGLVALFAIPSSGVPSAAHAQQANSPSDGGDGDGPATDDDAVEAAADPEGAEEATEETAEEIDEEIADDAALFVVRPVAGGTELTSTDDELPTYTVRAVVDGQPSALRARASTTVTRDEMRERLARSAPDALRWIPGVSVQQTTHGQASPYVRGLTGQQVFTALDGVRLNNGTYRQGPNQYFFTIDAASLERIEVLRGSASTRWGFDAMGGAVLAQPVEPRIDPRRTDVSVTPRITLRGGSGDLDFANDSGGEYGARLEVESQLTPDLAVIVGGGYRVAERLQGAGLLRNPSNGEIARVPLVELDGRTQRGTGYRYATLDGRVVWRIAPELRLVAGLYIFREFDTPRADRCPPPFGDQNECLRFVEQFHTLGLLSLRGAAGPELREVEVTISYQQQHEYRVNTRPPSFVRYDYWDDVDTYGIVARLGSRRFVLAPDVALTVRAGGDYYTDRLRSRATLTFTDLDMTFQQSRGQYSDRSSFYTSGLYADAELELGRNVKLRGGGRWGFAGARAPSDPLSGTRPVSADWNAPVGRVGLEWAPSADVTLFANIDQGFRAPNLDDLTSRQIIGPGFQFENADLHPERSTTYEVGTRVGVDDLAIDAWAYAMQIDGAIVRAPRSMADCPPLTPACDGSWTRFQLVNVDGDSWVLGTELSARLATDFGLQARGTLALTWGEGPNPAQRPTDPNVPFIARVPMSRIPPVNGTAELRYAPPGTTVYAGVAFRWALAQDRLAPQDLGDARIPLGGTPAYATFDLRFGFRIDRYISLSAVFENILDQVYRVHGSGVNGAGRNLGVEVRGEL